MNLIVNVNRENLQDWKTERSNGKIVIVLKYSLLLFVAPILLLISVIKLAIAYISETLSFNAEVMRDYILFTLFPQGMGILVVGLIVAGFIWKRNEITFKKLSQT